MQFKEREYYGEIWFPENEANKCFCILKKEENKIILTTNLSERNIAYAADLIFGLFTGLGYLTFINNKIINSVLGMITSKSYSPEYCLIGEHFLEKPKEFRTLKATIVNPDLRKWMWILLFDLYSSDNSISYDKDIKEEVVINNKCNLSFYTWTNHKTSRDTHSLQLLSKASVKFDFKEQMSILEVKELYQKFQKFLLFFHGSTKQFESFNLICNNCNNDFELYYTDGFHKEQSYSSLNLNYQDLKENINDVIYEWFNNEDILICVDKVLNNTLSSKLSYQQKFINAYIALESYLKRFCNSNGKDFKVYLQKNSELILSITKKDEEVLDEYLKMLIRTRDYYVHDNIKQKKYFQGIDLLYEARMIESLVSILILKQLKVGEAVIEKVISRANQDYVGIKQLNVILGRNILE